MWCGPVASLILLALGSGQLSLDVQSATGCPDAGAVQAKLVELLPNATTTSAPDKARLWQDQTDLTVRLESADGTEIGTRRFSRTSTCADLAAAAAVALATWESDVHPQFAPAMGAWAIAPGTADPGPTLPAAPALWNAMVGAAVGLGGAIDAPAAAADGALVGWVKPSQARMALRIDVEGQSTRRIALQDGQASWRRWSLGAGLERSFFPAADSPLSWFGLARLGVLDLRGEGFPQNHTSTAFDPGVTAGLRWARAAVHWSVGVELAATLWPRRHDAFEAGGTEATGQLPLSECFVRAVIARGPAP